MITILLLGYGFIGIKIASDLHKVTINYKVTCNGKRWIVRSNKGKFVKMPKVSFNGFFGLLSLAN